MWLRIRNHRRSQIRHYRWRRQWLLIRYWFHLMRAFFHTEISNRRVTILRLVQDLAMVLALARAAVSDLVKVVVLAPVVAATSVAVIATMVVAAPVAAAAVAIITASSAVRK